MTNEDVILLFNYIKDKKDLNEEMSLLLNKLEIIVKQIKVDEQYHKDMEKLGKDLQELLKKNAD